MEEPNIIVTENKLWPRISIVCPSFNQAKFLEETIKSILNQNYPNLEFFIIDGGSSDGSLDVIRKYEKHLAFWVSEPDRGQSEAINKGFQRCSGDLITFQNSDDIYLPGAFSFASEQWRKNPGCGAIIGGFQFITEKSEVLPKFNPPRLPYPSPLDLSLLPPDHWRLHQVATFYTKGALDHVGRYVREDLRYVMDRELLFRVCKEYQVITDDRAYAAFRRHADSKTMSSAIQFGEEFAQLYIDSQAGSERNKRIRRNMAQFYRAKGYLHFAKYHSNLTESNRAFLKVIQMFPGFAVTKGFWAAFIKRNLLRR